MSNVQWADVKFFPEPTGELYGWILATLVLFLVIIARYMPTIEQKKKKKKKMHIIWKLAFEDMHTVIKQFDKLTMLYY